MPTYKVTDPNTGKTIKLTGDSPPTEQELEEIFSKIGGQKQQPQQEQQAPKESVPQMLGRNLAQAGTKTIDQGANILNSLLLGAPQAIAGQFGKQFVNESNLTGGEQLAGQALGFAAPGSMIAKGVGAMVKGAGLGAKVGRAAAQGGAVGAVLPPEENWGNIQERAKNAVIGSLLGMGTVGAGTGLAKVSELMKKSNYKEQSAVLKNIRTAFHQQYP